MSVKFGDSTLGADIQSASLNADINAPSLSVKFIAPSISAGSGTQIIRETERIPTYDGSYVIIPKAGEDQILPTDGKKMTDDLTVTKVPYFETSNEYGDTVYIASEV